MGDEKFLDMTSIRRWRDAATLMLISRHRSGDSFSVLMLKRSSRSSFMPNAVVFPGGVIDEADRNPAWLPLLRKWRDDFPLPVKNISRPMIYKHSNNHPEVSFRINAIRETFEETGILWIRNP